MAAARKSAVETVETGAEIKEEIAVAETPKKRPGRRKKTEEPEAAEAVTEPKKKPGRKPAAKKAEEAVSAETSSAETPKKRPGRKPAAKKAAAPEVSIVLQYDEKEIATKDLAVLVAENFRNSHADVEIKTIEIYVKPGENVAYYVVNGEGSDDYKIGL